MDCRRFNAFMPFVNEAWASRVLAMKHNLENGPDLIGEKADCEIKFTYLHPTKNYPRAWTVQEHQMRYSEGGKPIYWGLGTYRLSVPVSSIRTKNKEKLEGLVTPDRELFIVSWEWMNNYQPSNVVGETERSKWNNTFRYPKKIDLPKVVEIVQVNKGTVHITEGVNIEHFDFQQVNCYT